MTSADAIRNLTDPQVLTARVRELVSIESPTGDATASRAISEVLTAWWSPFGVVVPTVDPVGTHLVVDVPGTGARAGSAPVLLLGHSDTVWPTGTLAGAVPWIDDGTIVRGPGVYDMKAGLVIMHAAVVVLATRGVDRPPLRVVISADEEVGSGTSTGMVIRASAGVAAVLGFESPHPDGALKVGRLGSARVQVRITGRESHAALDPDAGVSAIDELVDQLVALRARCGDVIARRPGDVLVNVGTVAGGGRTNVVPGSASAQLGFRSASAPAHDEVMAALAALRPVRAGAQVDVDVLTDRPAWAASASDRDLLARVAAIASRLGQTVTGRPAAGAADTNTTGALGVPTLDGFGPRGGGAHAVSEHISVASLRERVVLLAGVLAGL